MKNKVETATATPPKDNMVLDGEAAAAQAAMPQAFATADVHKVPPKVQNGDLAGAAETAMFQGLEFPPEPVFISTEEQRALLQQACQQFPGFRPDGPPLSFHFDAPPIHQAQQIKRKMSDVSGQFDGGHPAKVAKKSLDPQELLQKQLEDEEKRAKKVQLKADREQAKLNTTLKKEQERKMREADRERQRMEKEANKYEAILCIIQMFQPANGCSYHAICTAQYIESSP